MHWFYLEETLSPEPVLDEGESHHAVRVLRLQEGEKIMVTDGKGSLWLAEIAGLDPRATGLKIIEKNIQPPRIPGIRIAIAPPKSADRMEWFVEKATECGVEQITPLLCSRSERKTVNTGRLRKIVISALKQSKQAWLPLVDEMTRFEDLVRNTGGPGCYITHTGNGNPGPFLGKILEPEIPVTILIGPEGGFSPDEISMALANGFQAAGLGKNILRTETAGIFAAHTVRVVSGLSEE